MPDTSASIPAGVMMQMWTTKLPPTGTYPNIPTLQMADLVYQWVTDQPGAMVPDLDKPATGEEASSFGPMQVSSKRSGVTLAYYSLICQRGLTTPEQINAAVIANPFLVPSSLSGGTISGQDFYDAYVREISPQLAPTNQKVNDDPWNAYGVAWPTAPTPRTVEQIAQDCYDCVISGQEAGKPEEQIVADLVSVLKP